MKSTSKRQQNRTVESTDGDHTVHQFEEFEWVATRDLPPNATVLALEHADLVGHVRDVTGGAIMVFELMADRSHDPEKSYLNAYHLGLLQRMTVRALGQLDVKAQTMMTRLQKKTWD